VWQNERMGFIQIQSWECAGGCLETMRPSSYIIFRLKLIYRAPRFPFKARQDHYPYARAQRARSTFQMPFTHDQAYVVHVGPTCTYKWSAISPYKQSVYNIPTSSDSLTQSLVSLNHFLNIHQWISSPHFPPSSLMPPSQSPSPSPSPRPRPPPRHPSTRSSRANYLTGIIALSHRLFAAVHVTAQLFE